MSDLHDAMQEAHDLGFLGPGPADSHIAHAAAFLSVVEGWDCEIDHVVDLGTGGGVPGLVAATRWADSEFVFVEANVRRATFLRRAARSLAPGRVRVIEDRAERVGRNDEFRGRFPLVMARSFAMPAVTAECAAPFLRVGGSLVVSEPPEPATERWPATPLAELGMGVGRHVSSDGVTVQEVQQRSACGDRYPRPDGVPTRKPLYDS